MYTTDHIQNLVAILLSLVSICTVYVRTCVLIQIQYVYESMTLTIIYWTVSIYPHNVQIRMWHPFWSLPGAIQPYSMCLQYGADKQSDRKRPPAGMLVGKGEAIHYVHVKYYVYVYIYGPTMYIWKQSFKASNHVMHLMQYWQSHGAVWWSLQQESTMEYGEYTQGMCSPGGDS